MKYRLQLAAHLQHLLDKKIRVNETALKAVIDELKRPVAGEQALPPLPELVTLLCGVSDCLKQQLGRNVELELAGECEAMIQRIRGAAPATGETE